MTQKIQLAENLTNFFEEEICSCAAKNKVSISDSSVSYVAKLLYTFSNSQKFFQIRNDPFANKEQLEIPSISLMWLEAFHEDKIEQLMTMQKVGDIALFTSGFFSEHLDRKHVDLDFYSAIGERAYERAGHLKTTLQQERALNVFFELASKFPVLRELLNEVAERSLLHSEKGQLKLYEKWLGAKTPRIQRMLAEIGIIASTKADKDDAS